MCPPLVTASNQNQSQQKSAQPTTKHVSIERTAFAASTTTTTPPPPTTRTRRSVPPQQHQQLQKSASVGPCAVRVCPCAPQSHQCRLARLLWPAPDGWRGCLPSPYINDTVSAPQPPPQQPPATIRDPGDRCCNGDKCA